MLVQRFRIRRALYQEWVFCPISNLRWFFWIIHKRRILQWPNSQNVKWLCEQSSRLFRKWL